MFHVLFVVVSLFSFAEETDLFWIKVDAQTKFERSVVADTGVTLEVVDEDYVVALGNSAELEQLKKMGMVLQTFPLTEQILKDFPHKDRNFHNYGETIAFMNNLKSRFPNLVAIEEIGKSFEDRSILNIRISSDLARSHQKPGIFIMGTHHAREHLSTEMGILLAKHLAENYATDPQIKRLLDSREIHIVPMVNPDGVEYDIATGKYRMWRKNRSNDGYGVDLNRNYGFKWGSGGSSSNPYSDTYMGPKPFSEPETQAIKNFVEAKDNINITLSLHTFSELILYPWGYTYDSIANHNDMLVHKKMAETMAAWNGYTPQQSSDLYITSGDTTDWAYGEHGIISFTFELDPKSMWSGGFYPGQDYIPRVFQKNLKPFLYLIDYADNPYRVLESKAEQLGFSTEVF